MCEKWKTCLRRISRTGGSRRSPLPRALRTLSLIPLALSFLVVALLARIPLMHRALNRLMRVMSSTRVALQTQQRRFQSHPSTGLPKRDSLPEMSSHADQPKPRASPSTLTSQAWTSRPLIVVAPAAVTSTTSKGAKSSNGSMTAATTPTCHPPGQASARRGCNFQSASGDFSAGKMIFLWRGDFR